jgi:hypothetical protein
MPKQMTQSRLKLEIPSESDPSFRWMVIAFLVLVEVMLFGASLFHGFVGYDYTFRELYNRSLTSLWSTPTDALGHWRPLSYSINQVLFSFFGEIPFYWHLFNVLIHLASVLLFFQILLRLSESVEKRGLTGPAIAAIIFQAHPAAVQNVYWVSGFSDLLCMFFLLLAVLCSVVMLQNRKSNLAIWAAASFAAALLSKESAIVFPIFLALVLYLAMGTWQSVLSSHRRLLSVLSLLAVLFGVAFAFVSGQIFLKEATLFAGGTGVIVRGLAMLVMPTDAMRLYQIGVEAPLAAVGLAAFVLFVIVLLLRMKLLNVKVIGLLAVAFLAWFTVYAAGGYVSLRLMYGSIGFFVLAMFVVLRSRRWWTDVSMWSRLLRGCIVVYVGATLFFSFSSVMDWHVADKFAGAIRASFVDHHLAVKERQYIFGAIPSRLRQAEIVREPGTDFRGQLRKEEMSDSLSMRSLLRIVLLDRDDVSANVLLLRTSDKSLIVNTQTENQFFLFGNVDTPNELPVGTKYEDGTYSLEVLETMLNDRPVAVKVTVSNPADLDRLLFYDDQDRQFISLRSIEAMSQDETDE